MGELLGRLTNLTYELFGVVVPGIVMAVFVLLWWCAVGPLGQELFASAIPSLTLNSLLTLLGKVDGPAGVFGTLFVAYFLGHSLLWVARAGPPLAKERARISRVRMGYCLIFRIPKPAESFDSGIRRLFEAAAESFSRSAAFSTTKESFSKPMVTEGQAASQVHEAQQPPQPSDPANDQLEPTTASASATPNTGPMTWREFYPVAKIFVAQRVKYSLVATYQNKYTLHRSFTTAAALLFWLAVGAILLGIATHAFWAGPNYPALCALTLFALVLIWGFSDSYMFHWKNFGNTLVTESYATLYGPDERKKRD